MDDTSDISDFSAEALHQADVLLSIGRTTAMSEVGDVTAPSTVNNELSEPASNEGTTPTDSNASTAPPAWLPNCFNCGRVNEYACTTCDPVHPRMCSTEEEVVPSGMDPVAGAGTVDSEDSAGEDDRGWVWWMVCGMFQ